MQNIVTPDLGLIHQLKNLHFYNFVEEFKHTFL